MKLSSKLTRGIGAVSVASLMVACGDKEAASPAAPPAEKQPAAEAPAGGGAAEEAPAADLVASLSLEDRAALMGFAQQVHKEYEVYMSLDLGKILAATKGTRLEQMVSAELEGMQDEEMPLWAMKDGFMAAGAGVGEQLEVWYKLINEINKVSTLAMLENAAVEAGLMDPEDMTVIDPSAFMEGIPARFSENFDEYIEDIEKLQMPPVMVGMNLGDYREEFAADLAMGIEEMGSMLPPFVQRSDVQRGEDGEFTMFRLLIGDMIDKESFRGSMEEIELTDAEFERFYKALSEKTVVMAAGFKGDHFVFFYGSNEEQLKFAESVEESVVAKPVAAFVDGYADKNVVSATVMDEATLAGLFEGAYKNPLEVYTDPLREVLGRIDSLGDKRDLVAMLDRIDELSIALSAMDISATSGVGFVEDGLKFEFVGGMDQKSYDTTSPMTLGGLADGEDVIMSWGATMTKDAFDNGFELYDVAGAFAYAMTKRYSALDATPAEMSEMFDFVDQELADDLLVIWDGVKTQWVEGLAPEGIMLMDGVGDMPRFAGVPSEITEEGKIPRMAMIYPVVDREKLAGSWESIEPALRQVIEKVAAKAGQTFTLPDASTSEINGLKIYSYPVTGFTNDDLVPALAVSDDYFILASSKNLAVDLVEKLKSGAVKPVAGGMRFDMNMKAVRAMGRDWVELARKYPEQMAGVPALEDLDADELQEVLDWMEMFDGMHMRTFEENGRVRFSAHLAFKDLPEDAVERINGDDEEVLDDEEEVTVEKPVEVRLVP
ncbi:hypothetical protein [Sulfuriroseicoccus oceanibius]|uniref:DUF3352 domain-containing protein n=1 Tax=Sulfuriroseicoccus oceanibius TaxID=2707525 RepID=A0A6B3L546_9BACT|nr:hypothetical protein [Sulfuriroseicoccus oceanibius]QQL45849.1 hypothetical protein G3M56_004495 [Sulfuriroseicoccus oceanibius]